MAEYSDIDDKRKEKQRKLFAEHKAGIERVSKENEEISLEKRIKSADHRKEVLKKLDAPESMIAAVDKEAGLPDTIREFRPTPTGRDTAATLSVAERLKKAGPTAEVSTEAPPPDKGNPFPSFSDKVKSSFTRRGVESTLAPAAVSAPTDDLAEDLRSARAAYKDANDKLETREAIEAIANGFGKIGAGLAGQRSGTDMSGVKFDSKDWERKRDRTQKDFQVDLADVEGRRKEQIQQSQYDKDLDYRNRALSEQTRHQKAMEAVYGTKALEEGAAIKAKMTEADLKKFQDAASRTSAQIFAIGKEMSRDNKPIDEKQGRERIKSTLKLNLGLSDEDVDKVMITPGTFWDSNNDPDVIQQKVTELATSQLLVKTLRARRPEGSVIVQNPDGKYGYIPSDSVSEALELKYKIIP